MRRQKRSWYRAYETASKVFLTEEVGGRGGVSLAGLGYVPRRVAYGTGGRQGERLASAAAHLGAEFGRLRLLRTEGHETLLAEGGRHRGLPFVNRGVVRRPRPASTENP